MRSSWKPYFNFFSFKKFSRIRHTNSVITAKLEGTRLGVYNGKSYQSFVVRDYMIGNSLSNYCDFKKIGKGIHPVKNSQRSKKKRSKK